MALYQLDGQTRLSDTTSTNYHQLVFPQKLYEHARQQIDRFSCRNCATHLGSHCCRSEGGFFKVELTTRLLLWECSRYQGDCLMSFSLVRRRMKLLCVGWSDGTGRWESGKVEIVYGLPLSRLDKGARYERASTTLNSGRLGNRARNVGRIAEDNCLIDCLLACSIDWLIFGMFEFLDEVCKRCVEKESIPIFLFRY